MAIETLLQTIETTEVGQVIITDPVEDSENDAWVREIRVYGEAEENADKPIMFTLRISGATKSAIEVSAPIQTF